MTYPDGDDISLLDASVNDAMVAGGEHVGEVNCLLVCYIVWNGEKVNVAIGDLK